MEEMDNQLNSMDKVVITSKTDKDRKKKKTVGFAPPSEEVREFRQDKVQRAKEKFHEFHKVPPELAYLRNKNSDTKERERMPGEAPVVGPAKKKVPEHKSFEEIRDIRYVPLKEFSIQNKKTEFNFNYPEIDLPIPSNNLLVQVEYCSLSSFDIAKVNKFGLNLSNTKVGLGYEYAGVVAIAGKSLEKNYSVGQKVFGCVNVTGRQGTMTTSLLLNPDRDIIMTANEELLQHLSKVNPQLAFEQDLLDSRFEISSDSEDTGQESASMSYPVQEIHTQQSEIPDLAKLTCFPVLYCRAMQILSHVTKTFEKNSKACILINGADTNLGLTLIQLVHAPQYNYLGKLHLILVIRESSIKYMESFVKYLRTGKYYDPSRSRVIDIVPFNLVNEDIVLPGEQIPINYKKPELFASEILNCLLQESDSPITSSNLDEYKLDLFLDIVGAKKMFHHKSLRFNVIENVRLPYLSNISETTSLQKLFNDTSKEPFFLKIMKPKSRGSCYVSCCSFNVDKPTYNIDEQIIYSLEASVGFNNKLLNTLSNSFSSYYYYDETELEINKTWVEDGLKLLLNDYFKVRLDGVVDWTRNFKPELKSLKKDDKFYIFQIEKFM